MRKVIGSSSGDPYVALLLSVTTRQRQHWRGTM
jgi:hypothetical protein